MGFVAGLFKGNKYQADTGATGADVRNQTQATQDAIAQQQAFVNATGAQNGLQNQSDVYNQLSGISQGTGPNPAQAMLNQATSANVANQAALMAGQRGLGANAGLLARQAGQQGGALQQQAVGQGATMQANQAMNAINAMGGMANTQVGQQQNALNALGNQQQALQSSLSGGAQAGSQINANVAQQNQQQKMGILKGVTGAIAQGATMAAGMAAGGVVGASVPNVAGGAKSNVAKMFIPDEKGIEQDAASSMVNIGDALTAGIKAIPRPVAAAPVQQVMPMGMNVAVPQMAQGGNVGHALRAGGNVPGKPAVAGAKDSYSNDIVDAKLSPGEIVLPRSVTQSEDPVGNAAKFVAAIMAKQGMKKPAKKGK